MGKKLKTISSISRQIILRKLGMYASSNLGNDIYYLFEAVLMLREDIGDEPLKEYYGEDWVDAQNKFKKLSYLVNKVKVDYDRVLKYPKDKKIREEFIQVFSKIPLVQEVLYEFFFILLQNTTLQYNKIPSDAIKIIERKGFTKINKRQIPEEDLLDVKDI